MTKEHEAIYNRCYAEMKKKTDIAIARLEEQIAAKRTSLDAYDKGLYDAIKQIEQEVGEDGQQ